MLAAYWVGVANADELQAKARAYDGTEFIVTKRRWRHILDRHPEMSKLLDSIVLTAESPEEAYADPRGAFHLLRGLKKDIPGDFLVVIARNEGSKTYLVTAYPIGKRRKNRRYRKYRKLPLSWT